MFGPGQPSRTSITVAALRAFGSREPDASVRNPDWLAERIIGPEQLTLIHDHPVVHALKQEYREARRVRGVGGMSNLLLIRTRFIDDRLKQAVQDGVTQVVILGAGFDTRAYRFSELLKNSVVFEVDYQSTQDIKRQRLREAFISIPPNVRFAQIDFQRENIGDVLHAAGYKRDQKTFFIWEGVSMYLTEQAVRQTLRTIARESPAGSTLVTDFAGGAMIDLLRDFPRLSQHRYTTAWGEPWVFGVPDGREKEFFAQNGLELREALSLIGKDAAKRYLRRADGTKLGSVRESPGGDWWMLARALWRFLTVRSKWYAIAALELGDGEEIRGQSPFSCTAENGLCPRISSPSPNSGRS